MTNPSLTAALFLFSMSAHPLTGLEGAVATYEGFDHYETGTALSSANTNGFGWSGGWYREDLTTSPSLGIPHKTRIRAPEDYVSLATHSISPTHTASVGGLGRQLDTAGTVDLSTGRTVYFSVLIRRNAAQDQVFGLTAAGSSHMARVALTTGNQVQVSLRNGSGAESNAHGGNIPAGDGDFLLIARFCSSVVGQETLSAKVYAAATDSVPYYEPATWDVVVSRELGTGTLDAVFFLPDARESSPLSVTSALMGEFRMAADWRDVVGAPRRIAYPPDAGVLDVTAAPYNASGNGVADDTAAIQSAIHDALANSQNTGAEQIVYLPEGTYLVSGTLWGRLFNANPALGIPQFGLILQGESESGTIIQLADSTFTNPATPSPVIWFGADSSTTGNDAFDNYLRDITIQTGNANPGAVGVDFLGNNNASIRRVTIRSGDGQGVIGLDMRRAIQGPELISRLTVEGFQAGIETAFDRLQITFEDITLKNQGIVGIQTESNTLAIRLLRSENTVPVLNVAGNDSTISLREAWLNGGSGGSALVTKSRLYLSDIEASGYDRVLSHDGINIPGLSISEYYSDSANTFASPPAHLGLLSRQHPEFFDPNHANWANVVSFGANPNDTISDATAIQAAIDSGKSVLYFPTATSSPAEYRVNTPLFLRGNIRSVEGLFQELIGFSGSFAVEEPVTTIASIEDGPGTPLLINDLSLGVTSIYFHWRLKHNSSRDLVLTNCKANLINTRGCGDLYGANIGGAPWKFDFPQNAWFRQMNPETFRGINVLNNGGDLWIHGMKTERTTTAIKTVAGGRSEVHGAFHLGQWSGAEDVPVYETVNSAFSATFRTRGSGGKSFTTTAVEERSGTIDSIPNSSLPSSALFTSYPAGFSPPTQPVVSILSSIPSAKEDASSPVSGQFTLRRTGDLGSALSVDLQLAGDAAPGSDFKAIPASVTLPAMEGEITLSVDPLDDAANEGTEDVVLSITPNSAYATGWPDSAAVSISDDDLPAAPFSTTGLRIWLREGLQRAADGRIYRWLDASGNGNDAFVYNPIANQRAPEWNPHTFGSRGAAECDVDFFQFHRSTTIANSVYSQRTLFLVLQTGSDVTTRQMLYQQGNGTSGLSLYLENGSLYFAVWPSSTVTSLSLPVSTVDNLVITAEVDTAAQSMELTINGITTSTGLTSSNSFTSSSETASLGALYETTRLPSGIERGFGEFPLQCGFIGEFLIFNCILSSPDKAAVLAYLENRLTSGFATWQLAEFSGHPDGPSSAAADILADPELDGISNLIEYALGLDPLATSNNGLPFQSFTSAGGSTYLTLQVPRSSIRSDLTYTVQVSNDLQAWFSGSPYSITLQDIPTLLEVRSATSMETEPRQFVRLKVDR